MTTLTKQQTNAVLAGLALLQSFPFSQLPHDVQEIYGGTELPLTNGEINALAASFTTPAPAPIDGNIVSRPEGEPNRYSLLRYDERTGLRRWFGLIQWNGELLVERQEQLMAQIVAALNPPVPTAIIPSWIQTGAMPMDQAERLCRAKLAELHAAYNAEIESYIRHLVKIHAMKLPERTYFAPDGTLLNADGTRSIFDDVDK